MKRVFWDEFKGIKCQGFDLNRTLYDLYFVGSMDVVMDSVLSSVPISLGEAKSSVHWILEAL